MIVAIDWYAARQWPGPNLAVVTDASPELLMTKGVATESAFIIDGVSGGVGWR